MADGETEQPKHLLSLDGGGIKGISPLMILKAIMDEIRIIEDGPIDVDQTKPGAAISTTIITPERKPIDYFDLTGGTSTGAIIAVMLGRLGMNCTDAIEVYRTLSDQIFAIRLGPINISKHRILNKLFGKLILTIKLLLGSQFGAKYVDDGIDYVLKKHPPPDVCYNKDGDALLVAKRYDPHDAPGKMLMCATMINPGKAILFRDYTPPPDAIPETGSQDQDEHPPPAAPPYSNPGTRPAGDAPSYKKILHDLKYNEVTIKEAVRATSAAPTYLPAETIQNITFWDGGLLNNNPIDQVWSARYDLAKDCHTEPYVSTVLSLGTTFSTKKENTPNGLIARLIGVINKTVNFATNTDAKALDFTRNIYRRNLRQPKDQQTSYFRLNACTGDTVVGLADFQQMDLLVKMTNDYLALPDTQAKVKACAKLLARKN